MNHPNHLLEIAVTSFSQPLIAITLLYEARLLVWYEVY
jgi:hypothetical protein